MAGKSPPTGGFARPRTGKQALVTGATGYIGNRLTEELLREGHVVRCLVRKTSDAESLKSAGAEIWQGDVTDKESLQGIAKGMDWVFHLAAVGDVNTNSKAKLEEYRKVNVEGTENLLAECAGAKISKFVHFSSVAAMGDVKKEGAIDESDRCLPSTPYEISKYESEKAAFLAFGKNKTPVVILRPTMVYGRKSSKEAGKIESSARMRFVPIIGDGENLIHMVHVDDLVKAAICCAKKGVPGKVYIVTGESHTWNSLVGLFSKKMGVKTTNVHIPVRLARLPVSIVERACNLVGASPPFTIRRLDGLSYGKKYDTSKARKELGFVAKNRMTEGRM